MDESHSIYGPTTPSVCLIWCPELWLCMSVCALDKKDMNATSNTMFQLLFHIILWYAPKYSYTIDTLWNISYANDMFWNVLFTIDMLRNLSYVIDKLQNVSLVINMLQLLFAPSVMNQICLIEMTFVILHLVRLRLRILYILPYIL